MNNKELEFLIKKLSTEDEFRIIKSTSMFFTENKKSFIELSKLTGFSPEYINLIELGSITPSEDEIEKLIETLIK